MAVPAIGTTMLNEILRILREDIPFQVQDGDDETELLSDNVIYQPTRVQKQRPINKMEQLIDFPGLVVSEPLRTSVLTTGGTNERDEWHYLWLVQLIDQDLWENPGRIATWRKWVEQIMSAFMFTCLNGVLTPPTGQVKFTSATEVQNIDESMWIRHGNFIVGIEIEVQILQPRGIIV